MENKVKDVDIVITYVDNTDKFWQNQISNYNTLINNKRYRNWDNLIYWFRLVEKNMPFIRKVHLIVSSESQVPFWIDRQKVHVVFHKDIIPEKYLPTFNSTTIEMFLCRIPELSEKFIYFNDDMFPNREMSESDFFCDGLPIYQLINRTQSRNTFRMQCKNSYKLAKEVSGYVSDNLDLNYYFYIKHSADPMLRSVCLELWDKVGDKILKSLTKFREPFNYTQYLFPDYSIMTNRWKEGEYDFAYYTAAFLEAAIEDIENSIHKMICVNDSKDADFEHDKECILSAFRKRCPNKSRFEK